MAVQLEIDGSEINTARIATNGVMDHSVRLSETEEVLEENSLTNEIIKDASDVAGNSLNKSMVLEDQQASSEFRLELLASYTKQTLQRAENRINHS